MSIRTVRGSQGDRLMKVIKNPVNEQISITRTWGKKDDIVTIFSSFCLFEAEKC